MSLAQLRPSLYISFTEPLSDIKILGKFVTIYKSKTPHQSVSDKFAKFPNLVIVIQGLAHHICWHFWANSRMSQQPSSEAVGEYVRIQTNAMTATV